MTPVCLVLLFFAGLLAQASASPIAINDDDFDNNEFLRSLADAFRPLKDTVNVLKNLSIEQVLMKTVITSKVPLQNDICRSLQREALSTTQKAFQTAFGETAEARNHFSEAIGNLTGCLSWNPIESTACLVKELDEASDKFYTDEETLKKGSLEVATAVKQFNTVLLECVKTL